MSEKDDDVILLIEDNHQQSPMIRSDLVNVNAPLTPMSQDNRLLTLYEFNDKRNSVSQTDASDIYNDINYRKEKLYKTIKENKRKISTSLYIISAKYDLIYFRYNRISLLILIISTITTFIEAIRLTLINYQNDNENSEMSLIISTSTISLIINMISLILGTLLTILSSIVKFRNYRENMEKLKNIHDVLFNYKISYNKQKDLIDYFTMSNSLTIELFDKLVENVENMNKEIKDINIFENIRIKDIIKFNRIKINHDIELKKMTNKRELEFLKLTVESTKNKCLYENQKNHLNNQNIDIDNNNDNKEKKYTCFI
jgi:uncharacterized integral membrane protein